MTISHIEERSISEDQIAQIINAIINNDSQAEEKLITNLGRLSARNVSRIIRSTSNNGFNIFKLISKSKANLLKLNNEALGEFLSIAISEDKIEEIMPVLHDQELISRIDDNNRQWSFIFAVIRQNKNIVEELIKKKFHESLSQSNIQYLAIQAINGNSKDILSLLIDLGLMQKADKNELIKQSRERNVKYEIRELLIASGVIDK